MLPLARVILAASLLATCPALAEDDLYKPVEVGELSKNIAKYWAVGIVFKDAVVSPPSGQGVNISGRRYVGFMTKNAGECFIESSLIESQPELKVNRDYVLAGTVLQRPSGGWFSGGNKYIISITRIVPAANNVADLGEILKLTSLDKDNPDVQTLARMNELFTGLQVDIAARAQNQNISMSEMFAIGSSNRVEVQLMVTAALSSMAQQAKLGAEDMLAQYVLALLSNRYPPERPSFEEAPADIEQIQTDEELLKDLLEPEPVPAPIEPEPVKPVEKKAVKKPAAPALKPRLRASPAEATRPMAMPEEIVEPVIAPDPDSAMAPVPLAPPSLPEATPAHFEQTMEQLDYPKPAAAPAPKAKPPRAPAKKPAPAPPPPADEEDYNAPVPL